MGQQGWVWMGSEGRGEWPKGIGNEGLAKVAPK